MTTTTNPATTPATTTTATDPVVQDVTEVATALKVLLGAVAVLDPPTAVAIGIAVAGVALAPEIVQLAESLVADFKGHAQATGPITPTVQADVAQVEAELATPIAPSTTAGP